MAGFTAQDYNAADRFAALFSAAKWDDVTAEKAVEIFQATQWLMKTLEEIKRQSTCLAPTQTDPTLTRAGTLVPSSLSELRKSKQK